MMPSQIVSALPDAAFRSLALAAAVWAGLHLFRVRNVVALKSAWTFVLAAALLMPMLLPISARWPRATLVLPGVAVPTLPAAAPAAQARDSQWSAPAAKPAAAADRADGYAPQTAPPAPFSVPQLPAVPASPPSAVTRPGLTPFEIALFFYFTVAGLLLLRFAFGLFSAACLWFAAAPVSAEVAALAEGLSLRASAGVSSPVTIGSGVVLPADYPAWDREKLRIVLAHERSHIRQGDFYLQALAGLYAALIWVSPLGWWLKRKLSDLAEAISDRSGLEEAASRSSYAQILLEFAAAPRPTPIGVAMARTSNLSHRLDRLLNERVFRQAFTGNRRTLVTAVLVPLAMLAATTLVRVQAATQPPRHPAARSSQTVSGQPATPGTAVHVQVPAVHVNVPAIHVNVPAQHIDIPAIHVNVPAAHIDVPAQHVDVPAVHVNVPAQHVDVPARNIEVPAQHIDIPAIHIDVPSAGAQDGAGGHAAYGATGELMAMLNGFGHALAARASSGDPQATFDRTFSLTGKADLHIATGSGYIHLTRGSASQVHVHAIIHSNNSGDSEAVRELAANPPVEQQGNSIRIGGRQLRGVNHISIDYEIEAPADATLEAISGSGDIRDTGVGQAAKLMTGSGDIAATGLEGGFIAQTGSGDIAVENSGSGDAKVQTGSGDIDVKGVNGALKAQTGSGNIKAQGTPVTGWTLEAGSGNVEFWAGSAPLTLDASTGSGSIHSDQAMAMPTGADHHHVHANLNGGGPEVRIGTGSGDILIH